MNGLALLSGPPPAEGMEALSRHSARFGPLPPVDHGFIDVLEHSGLRGRGGAAFPVAAKWRSIVRGRGPAVVLANGGEGEPHSRKDQLLMQTRPHLVLDGAAVAARVVGAAEIVLFVGAAHTAALHAMQRALLERSEHERSITRLLSAPVRYVSGEESAAIHFVNEGVVLPTTAPPRPYERGVAGLSTLVQNVETLAHVALVARYGAEWFRSLGVHGSAGTALVTVSGAVRDIAVVEVPLGSTIADAVGSAGGATDRVSAVLLGGYFGTWIAGEHAWRTVLDDAALRQQGLTLGCGVVGMLSEKRCGVVAASRVMSYLAHESARQCGPCVFGLRAIAAATARLASGAPEPLDLQRIEHWTGLLSGRGACHHPDGAAQFLASALRVFETEFAEHQRGHRCTVRAPAAVSA